MTRPGMIRADTIDLQDHGAPSAQDRSHLKSPSANYASSPDHDDNAHHISAHQAETLRGVAAETAQDRRTSWTDTTLSDLHIHTTDLSSDIADSLNPSGHPETAAAVDDDTMTSRQQQDALAVAQNGGLASEATEEDMDDVDDELDDDMMDKISSSPSIEDEDIDFEFVYALHTFMATVEGQANATKGDTMVLLDDSNSYWWLVRVVKDSSIGYLPAEHIETPTERLARLNKHRNIDLSATMLGDQAEKAKNPLKTAIRRRKKTVAFAAPTYVDYSDIDYSTDEEDLEADFFAQQQQAQQQQQQQQQNAAKEEGQQANGAPDDESAKSGIDESDDDDDTAKVEPLKPRTSKESARADDANGDAARGKDMTRSSEEIFVASKSETPGPKKTKDGTVRDSFFKDDNVETKKITLTPNLLRDEGTPRASSESKDIKQRPSLDRLDKDINALLVKDEKKKKDKKGFRNFFSRKDKKRGDDDDESIGKQSMDTGSDLTEKDSRDMDDMDDEPAQDKIVAPVAPPPQRQSSKLQKAQPASARTEQSPTRKVQKDASATMRMVDSESSQDSSSRDSSPKEASRFNGSPRSGSSAAGNTNASYSETGRPQMVTKATARAVLNEFDSDEDVGAPGPQQAQTPGEDARQQQFEQQTSTKDYATNGNDQRSGKKTDELSSRSGRLSESPVQISPVNSNNPPALMVDSSSQEEDRSSPISSPSPELGGSEDRSGKHHAQDSITTSTSATTANTATWNDAGLRAFFDSGTDVRDLLLVVYDKTDVAPAGPDHPIVSTLFKEQNAKLAEITSQLDNMLGDWLARKQRLRGSL